MQAGRPYKDRLFPSGQFNCAIAGCSHSRQFYRVHVATTNGAIAALFPASANLVPSQYIANLFNINFVILAVIGLIF